MQAEDRTRPCVNLPSSALPGPEPESKQSTRTCQAARVHSHFSTSFVSQPPKTHSSSQNEVFVFELSNRLGQNARLPFTRLENTKRQEGPPVQPLVWWRTTFVCCSHLLKNGRNQKEDLALFPKTPKNHDEVPQLGKSTRAEKGVRPAASPAQAAPPYSLARGCRGLRVPSRLARPRYRALGNEKGGKWGQTGRTKRFFRKKRGEHLGPLNKWTKEGKTKRCKMVD